MKEKCNKNREDK